MAKKITDYVPAKRVRSVHTALRKLNRGWDVYDTTLILCCVLVFLCERDMEVPRNVATVLAHRLLADSLCRRYGCEFVYPNVVIHNSRGRRVVLPALQNVQIGDRKRRDL